MSPPFNLIDDEQMLREPDQNYLIDGVCCEESLVLTHGKSGHGKSFLGLDAAFSVATGGSWYGHAVNEPGPAVYIAAEGQPGLKDRIRAWKLQHGGEGRVLGVQFLLQAVDPLNETHVTSLHEQLSRLPEEPRLVVVDTWSACLAAGEGDENATRDTGRAVSTWRQIVTEFGATVWIIHHEGNAAPGRPRGSSALKAAAETEIGVAQKDGVVTVKNLKQRDGALFGDFRLRLHVVPVGGNRTSCVLVPDHQQATTASASLRERAKKALRALLGAEGGMTHADWRRASPSLGPSTFERAVGDLHVAGFVAKEGEGRGALYLLTDAGREYCHRHITSTDTASGSEGVSHDRHHQPSPPRRGEGGGGDGEEVDEGDLPETAPESEIAAGYERTRNSPGEDQWEGPR